MRIAVGAYQVVVNSFATQTTGLHNMRAGEMPRADLPAATRGGSALDGFLQKASERGWDIVPLGFFYPTPGRKLSDEAREWAKQQILAPLRGAARVDGVFMQLHGTAASDSIDDCEGDLLAALRSLVGLAPIYASLDGHANVSTQMAKAADVLIGVKTNPHSDFHAVGQRAAELMAAALEGSLKPVMVRAQPAMAPALQKLYIAPGWPMEHLMRVAQTFRLRDARILDVSLLVGFHLSDRAETGISVLVTTDGEPTLARDVADSIKNACWAMCTVFTPTWCRWRTRWRKRWIQLTAR